MLRILFEKRLSMLLTTIVLFKSACIMEAIHLKRDKPDNLSSVIPRETRNLRPARQRFLVSLGMTSNKVEAAGVPRPALSGWSIMDTPTA